MAPGLAVASALSFGVADFLGGLASRRASALTVTLVSQAVGVAVLLPALAVFGGEVSMAALAAGAVAGLAGSTGLLAYLRALAIGPMGVVSPLAAVTGAALPVAVGLAAGERPSTLATAGVALGLLGVVLATRTPREAPARAGNRTGPLLALAAGVGFGLFFVVLDATPADSGAWPLLGARLAALGLLGPLAVGLRRDLPSRPVLPLVAASGALDMVANLLFLAATRGGLLALTALLTSLYPVIVVVLAYWVLGERLARLQRVGVVLALAAVALIAVG